MATNWNEANRNERNRNTGGRNFDRDYNRDQNTGSFDEGRMGLRGQENRDYDRDNNQDFNRGYSSDSDRNYNLGFNRDSDRDYNWDSDRDYNRGYGSSSGRENREFGGDFNRGMNRGGYGSQGTHWGTQSLGRSDYGGNLGSDYNQGRYSEGMGISHVGKGPKGWKRSDDRIKEDVSDALERDHRVDASEIEVNVKGGIVTLKGSVDERRTKRLAEDVVENCPGVIDVRNELSIDQSLFQQAKDFVTGESSESKGSGRQKSRAKH